MREPRTGEKFAAENAKFGQQVIAAAAASMYSGTATAGPHVPTPLDDAHRAIELEHARVEHRLSARRNDPVDTRPMWREVESARRWGPAPQIPAAPSPVALTRAQFEAAIIGINLQLTERRRDDADLIAQRDQLMAQLQALQGTR